MKNFTSFLFLIPFTLLALLASPANAGVAYTDRKQVQDIMSNYAFNWDSKNAVEYAALFTDDCVYKTFANGEAVSEMSSSNERLTSFKTRLAQFKSNGISTRHILSNMILKAGSEGQIVGETYFYVLWNMKGKSAPIPKFSGVYRDIFSKTIDGWKISRHEIHLDQSL